MKLHGSDNRGRIILKTYKEHLLTYIHWVGFVFMYTGWVLFVCTLGGFCFHVHWVGFVCMYTGWVLLVCTLGGFCTYCSSCLADLYCCTLILSQVVSCAMFPHSQVHLRTFAPCSVEILVSVLCCLSYLPFILIF